MKKYVVTFALTRAQSDLRVRASRHVFDTIKEARAFAADYTNAFITSVEAGEIVGYIKTRDELRR